MRASVAACEKVNPHINAVVHRFDPPEVAASTGDLAGVPFLLKDAGHRWAGAPCEMGSKLAKGFKADVDGPIAARFRAGGLRPFGVTNSSEFAINATTEPVAFGPTQNPWKLGHSVGGSSGGAAAAVAAGIVPIAHASDGGGSIRMPAAWCGLYGLKPTRGRNPAASAAASDGNAWISVHHVVSKSLRDTAVALDLTCGADPGGFVPLLKPAAKFFTELGKPPGALRIAVCDQIPGGMKADPETLKALTHAVKILQDCGHAVEQANPGIGMAEISHVCFELFLSGIADSVDAMAAATGQTPGSDTLEPQTLASYRHASHLSAKALKSALNQLVAMSRKTGAFMSNYDVFLTPATASAAVRNGLYDAASYRNDPMSFWEREMELYDFLPLASLTGEPALVVPFLTGASGLPIGLQFTAKQNGEALLFRLASQFDEARPEITALPDIHATNFDT